MLGFIIGVFCGLLISFIMLSLEKRKEKKESDKNNKGRSEKD